MAKEAYYFSHDSNARNDPKIGAMRSVYGSEGYAWFWILVEMMRETEDYKLDLQGKYIFNAYAKQMDADSDTTKQFVHDCIHEFHLFISDDECFWSESLMRRMDKKEKTSEKRREAANARWGKDKKDANDMQMQSKSNAIGMQGKERKGNKNKVNENKVNENKKEYADYVFLTETEYDKLTELFGIEERDNFFLRYASWISGQTPRVQKSRSAYLTILNWHRDTDKRPQRGFTPKPTWENKLNKFQEMFKEAEVLEREAK